MIGVLVSFLWHNALSLVLDISYPYSMKQYTSHKMVAIVFKRLFSAIADGKAPSLILECESIYLDNFPLKAKFSLKDAADMAKIRACFPE